MTHTLIQRQTVEEVAVSQDSSNSMPWIIMTILQQYFKSKQV